MADTLSIASWNINSVRARIDIVEQFLTQEAPDILCLQETKVVNETFPADMFRRLGYVHQVLNGQKMHHGVAIMSRVPIYEDDRLDWQANGEARHVGVRLDNGVPARVVHLAAVGNALGQPVVSMGCAGAAVPVCVAHCVIERALAAAQKACQSWRY